MADARIVARLTEVPEFAALKEFFAEAKEKEYATIARRLFNAPQEVDQLDLAEKRGYYKGIEAVLATPQKLAAEVHRQERIKT